MNDSQRPFRGWLDLLLLASVLLVFVFAIQAYLSARRNVGRTTAELREASRMLAEIHDLQTTPPTAAIHVDADELIIASISAALVAAEIPTDSLQSVSPEQPTRIAASNYQQRITRFELRSVKMLGIAHLAEYLERDSDGLLVRDLVLTPHENANASTVGERWDARLTLTQLIYSPTSL